MGLKMSVSFTVDPGHLHTGAARVGTTGNNWAWQGGSTWVDWYPGQPNRLGNPKLKGKHTIHMNRSSHFYMPFAFLVHFTFQDGS